MSSTPFTSSPTMMGTTISERERELHAMCPGNWSTSGTTRVRRSAHAVPHTPRPFLPKELEGFFQGGTGIGEYTHLMGFTFDKGCELLQKNIVSFCFTNLIIGFETCFHCYCCFITKGTEYHKGNKFKNTVCLCVLCGRIKN